MVKVKLNDGKFEELPKGSKEGMYLDGGLKTNLDRVKKTIRKDWDYLYIIDGEVGAGKSVFAQQLCFYVSDGDFNVDEITFKPEEFRDQILKSKKFNGIVMDEVFRGMSSRAAMSETNKMLVSLLQEIRQRNLFIFIVIPSIWDLDKYVALHRAKGLFHIQTDEARGRGYWTFYSNREDQYGNSGFKQFFAEPKNKYKYPRWKNLKGRFTEHYPLGHEAYKEKKAKSLGDYVYKDEKKPHKDTLRLSKLLTSLNKNKLFSHRQLAELMELDHTTVGKLIRGNAPENPSLGPEPVGKEASNLLVMPQVSTNKEGFTLKE